FALGEDAHRLVTRLVYGLNCGLQLRSTDRLRKVDVDNDFTTRVHFGRIIGSKLLDRVTQTKARLPPSRGVRYATHQGIMLPLRKVFLHLLSYAPVLPPIKQEHDQDQYNAQEYQTDLQITHLSVRRITKYLCIYARPQSDLSKLQGRIDIYRHNTRYTLFLHGNANQLLGHLHRDFIMRNK